jgi:hypothetical protein
MTAGAWAIVDKLRGSSTRGSFLLGRESPRELRSIHKSDVQFRSKCSRAAREIARRDHHSARACGICCNDAM